jgi:hypothetical protein
MSAYGTIVLQDSTPSGPWRYTTKCQVCIDWRRSAQRRLAPLSVPQNCDHHAPAAQALARMTWARLTAAGFRYRRRTLDKEWLLVRAHLTCARIDLLTRLPLVRPEGRQGGMIAPTAQGIAPHGYARGALETRIDGHRWQLRLLPPARYERPACHKQFKCVCRRRGATPAPSWSG